MRLIFGIILGVVLTLGVAYVHDNNVPETPTRVTDRPIVNWDVLGAVAGDTIDWVKGLWGGSGQ
jgi:hypothetical protein